MSDFSSFYGGRMGASFVIVKQFDGIDIPQVTGNYVYKVKYLATTNDGNYFIYDTDHFIVKNTDNYKDYIWKLQALDGSTVDTKTNKEGTGPTSQQVLDSVLAEGMVQCFTKGGESTNEVNYGEYVIIDTPDKNDPDNGKVYRRGMQFDSLTGGAEYIGQIVGPQGETPEIGIDHYEDIISAGGIYHLGTYNETSEDLVPGYYKNGGIQYFNDEIKYVYATLKDEYGNVRGGVIGFKLPTLVQDFEAQSMSPYEQREVDPSTGKYYNIDLISEDPAQYIDGKWQHPFYQKWKIKIPHGYHGINSTDIEIVHTQTMPANFKDGFPGAYLYEDEDLTISHIDPSTGAQMVIPYSVDVLREAENTVYPAGATPIYNADKNIPSCKIRYNNQEYYVSKDDCYMDIVRYRETNFDNIEAGEIRYYEIGDYNTIRRIAISEDGVLTVFYSAIDSPQTLEQVLRWIDTKDTDGITIDENGTVKIYYNTLDEYGEHEYQEYPNVLDWITNVTLDQEGNFDVLFNNDTVQEGHYHTQVKWIDYIDILEDGTINFYWNTDTEHLTPAYTFSKMIKYLDDVEIETIAEGSTYEGTGDQKVHLTFNTTDVNGDKEVKIIGNPLNYIIEALVCVPNTNFPDVPYCHLLVYYADPAYRALHQDKWVRYPSEKVIDGYDPITSEPIYHIWDEWIDLGNVRGAVGGIHILTNVINKSELYDSTTGKWIPPEQLKDSQGTIIDPEAAGWAVTLGDPTAIPPVYEILFFDYDIEDWYAIGSIDSSLIDPSLIVVQSAPRSDQTPDPADVTSLKTHGFWFAVQDSIYAY